MLAQYAKNKGFKITLYTKTPYQEAVMRKYGFRDWGLSCTNWSWQLKRGAGL